MGVNSFMPLRGQIHGAVSTNVWVTTTEYARASPATIKKLIATAYAIATWANGHRSDSGNILMKYSKLDPTVVAAMTRTEYSTSLNPKLLQPLIDVGVKFGMLPGPVDGATLIAADVR
jgi:ABC-type nitrate/sulfonate/bicarbonate transport system substrate-binding protein